MKKRFKQGIGLLLIVAMLLSSGIVAFGSVEDEEDMYEGYTMNDLLEDECYLQSRSDSVLEYFGIEDQVLEDSQAYMSEQIQNGSIYMDENEHWIAKDEYVSSLNEDELGILEEILSSLNTLSDSGILEFEEIAPVCGYALEAEPQADPLAASGYRVNMLPVSELLQDEEKLEQLSQANNRIMQTLEPAQTDVNLLSYSPYPTLNIGNIVNQNKLRIRDLLVFFSSIMNQVHAFTLVTLDWILLVRPNGDWDYKREDLLMIDEPYECYLGKPENYFVRIMTGEHIGNYNYGYTGYLLFPYPVLIAGSIFAGKFNIKLDKEDWPEIKNGYNDSRMVGYK